MGKETSIDIRPVDETTGEEIGKRCCGSTNSKDTGETGRTGGRIGGDTGRSTGGTTEKETVIPRLADVTEDEKKAERNRRRRERYRQQKEANGGTVKPRKVNGTKGKQNNTTDNTQVKMIIGTVSSIVASRPNMAHWQLTPNEIETLATPISNMLAESEVFKGLEEHSNAVALVTACFTIFVPRIVLTMAIMPKKEKEKKPNGNIRSISDDRPKRGQTNKDKNTNGKTDGQSSPNGTNDDKTEFWLGGALA